MMLASMGTAVFLFERQLVAGAVGRCTLLVKFWSSKNRFQKVLGRLRRGETPLTVLRLTPDTYEAQTMLSSEERL